MGSRRGINASRAPSSRGVKIRGKKEQTEIETQELRVRDMGVAGGWGKKGSNFPESITAKCSGMERENKESRQTA